MKHSDDIDGSDFILRPCEECRAPLCVIFGALRLPVDMYVIGDEARGTGWERHIGKNAITPHTECCPTIRTERITHG